MYWLYGACHTTLERFLLLTTKYPTPLQMDRSYYFYGIELLVEWTGGRTQVWREEMLWRIGHVEQISYNFSKLARTR